MDLPAALVAALWCAAHSLFITHRWQRLVRRRLPRWRAFERLIYVLASTCSFIAMMLWLRSLPARTIWAWEDDWVIVRRLGLALAILLFFLGARVFDGRAFLGVRQAAAAVAGREPEPVPFRQDGILGVIRHPWYAGTMVLLVFMGPVTDVSLAWRLVFFLYVLVGTELEERKLLTEMGETYAAYRRQVPRFLPRIWPRSRYR